jgi:hypothetical protein
MIIKGEVESMFEKCKNLMTIISDKQQVNL